MEIRPALSVSECTDCTTEGAAEENRDHLLVGVGSLRVSFEEPVVADTVKDGVAIFV